MQFYKNIWFRVLYMKSALAYRVMLSVLLAEHQFQWWTEGSPTSRQHPRWEKWPTVSLSTAANICICTDSQSGAMTWCWFTHIWECVFCHCVSQGYIWLPLKNLPISVTLVIQPQSRKVCKVCLERSVTTKYLCHYDMLTNNLTIFIYINLILSNLLILHWTFMRVPPTKN